MTGGETHNLWLGVKPTIYDWGWNPQSMTGGETHNLWRGETHNLWLGVKPTIYDWGWNPQSMTGGGTHNLWLGVKPTIYDWGWNPQSMTLEVSTQTITPQILFFWFYKLLIVIELYQITEIPCSIYTQADPKFFVFF